MTQMSLAQARVVDPVLTTVAQGYKQPDLVGMFLFPAVPVDLSGGQVLEFGKEGFQLYATARAPGTDTKRVQFGYLGKPYALENHGLEGLLPMEINRDAKNYPGVDLGRRAINQPMRSITLALEYQQAGIATNAANYDANHKLALSGASQWSDDTSDPIKAITDAREAIRASTGMYPNVAEFGPKAWNAFINHPKVIARIQYTQKAVITEDIAASLLEIAVVKVGKAIIADNSGAFSDVWGNNVVLAYTALGSLGQEEPSYGYTYVMRGNPAVEQPYYDNRSRSWVFPVFYERAPVLTGITAGFLFQTVSA